MRGKLQIQPVSPSNRCRSRSSTGYLRTKHGDKPGDRTGFYFGGVKSCTTSAKRAEHSIHITAAKERTNLNFVIPSELRISYYAALINDHVCGFL